jgi:curved DNA-binding protein
MDYYSALGVEKTATQDDIRKAYKKMSMKHHPDRGGDEAEFKKINEAYQTLSNAEKKQMYDTYGTSDPQQQWSQHQYQDFNDIFSSMFGHRRPRQKNKDILCTTQVDLVDIIKGKEMDITYTLPSGQQQTASVHIPAGMENNSTIRYGGLGDNSFTQLPRGDLLVKTIIRNPRGWDRQGLDLITFVEVDVFDAMIGTHKIIRTLENKTLKVNIPSGTQFGQIFSIPNHGITNYRTGQRGNIFVKVKVIMPNLDDKAYEDVVKYVKEAKNEYSKISK